MYFVFIKYLKFVLVPGIKLRASPMEGAFMIY